MGNTVQDRRAHSRLVREVPCRVETGGDSREAILHELSVRAAVIESTPLTVGSEVKLLVTIPESAETVSLRGEVVASNEDMNDGREKLRYIVRFDSISPESSLLMKSLQPQANKST